MALHRVTVWAGQSESGPKQGIVFLGQSSYREKSALDWPVTIDMLYAWYWSPKWQVWEKEADEDWQAGRYEVFETMDDFIASLDNG